MSGYVISRLTSNSSNLILCLVGIRSFRKVSPSYAQLFTILNIYEQLAGALQWWQGEYSKTATITSNIAVIAEMVVYSFIFFKIIYSKIIKWLTVSLITMIILRYTILALRLGDFFRITIDFQVYAYLVFLIPAFTYFREIFIYHQEQDLVKSFTFWLITGTAFYSAASVVYILGLNYLLMTNAERHFNDFYLFSGIVFLISNCLFIKAFLCLRNSSQP
jgi:hypothetical protein